MDNLMGLDGTKKTQLINRRDFLKIIAISGIAVGIGSKLYLKMLAEGELTSYSETRLLMGTIINLTVVAPGKEIMPLVIENTFSEMRRLINIFDHRSSISEVGRLNQEGQLVYPSQELQFLINKALSLSAITAGAFDITVKPVLDAYQQKTGVFDELKSLVDFKHIESSPDYLRFNKAGVQITLDGIAKGAVIDAGVDVLAAQGFENVLVEAGGDLMAAGNRGENDRWQIGIKHPRSTDSDLYSVVGINNQAAATSGDYLYYFSEDYTKHHIIDPITLESPKELASVTVLAPTALDADAFSTAIMVMGSEKGIKLIDQLPGVESLLVTKDLQVHSSARFPANLDKIKKE